MSLTALKRHRAQYGMWEATQVDRVMGLFVLVIMLRTGAVAQDPALLRGDTNDNGTLNIADPIRTLNILFPGDFGISCDSLRIHQIHC